MEEFDPAYDFTTPQIDIDEEEDPITRVHVKNKSIGFWFDIDGRERIVYRKQIEDGLLASDVFSFPDGLSVHRRRGQCVWVTDGYGTTLAKMTARGGISWIVRAAFALYASESIKLIHGADTSYGSGVQPFLDWLIGELRTNGFMGWISGDKMYVPFPDELWAIYRVQIMARYNLTGLPHP
jgi:hypothetical protein